MRFVLKELPSTIAEDDLLKEVQELNDDKTIHGLIVQLPLPENINEARILDVISPQKDVDGLSALNIGKI